MLDFIMSYEIKECFIIERLTRRTMAGTPNLDYPKSCFFPDGSKDQVSVSAFRQRAIERLADYEDSEVSPKQVYDWANTQKNGRLNILPCKVGDTVYVKTKQHKWDNKELIKCLVTTMRIMTDGKTITYTARGQYANGYYYSGNFRFSSIGKIVFLNKEDAIVHRT